VMPVTFVDGSSAELVFPNGLGLGDMGALMFTAGGLGNVDRGIDFRYGDGSCLMGDGPTQVYEGAGGTRVETWVGPPECLDGGHLVYRFGDWFVGVRTDRLIEAERGEWARNLGGSETEDGFLVLRAIAPLFLQKAGEPEGPEILLQAKGGNPFIRFFPGPCQPDPAEGEESTTLPDGVTVSFSRIGKDWFADWCEDGTIRIQVNYATREYAEAAARDLRVRKVRLADS
jgi:hypothetical protein